MDFVVSLIKLFSATPIYDNVQSLSLWMLTHITPVLVVIAMWVRLVETQLDGFSGQSRYAVAVRDFLWYGFLLSVYMALGTLVSYAFNTFYGLLNEKGSFEVVFTQMQTFITDINQMEKDDGGLGATALNLMTAPVTGISYFVYYISLIVVVFLLVVMRLALAVGYGLVFVWGLVAIPLSMTSNYKVLRGWGIFAGGILLWPVIEAILIWFFSPVLSAAAQALVSGDAKSFLLEKAGVYLLYTVLNLLIAAIVIAAPLIAGMTAANNSAMNSLVMPFAGAAMAAAAATIKTTRQRMTGGVKDTASAVGNSDLAKAASGKIEDVARSMTGMGPAPKPTASNAGSTSKGGRLSASLSTNQSGSSATSVSANTVNSSTETKSASVATPSQQTSTASNNATEDKSQPNATPSTDTASTAKKTIAVATAQQVMTATNTVSEPKPGLNETQPPEQQKNEPARKRTRNSEDARRGYFINKNLKNKGNT